MKVSKKELEDMRARVADGTASDDDRRLVDLYAGQDEPDATDDGQVGVVSVAEAEVIRGDTPKKTTRSRSNR